MEICTFGLVFYFSHDHHYICISAATLTIFARANQNPDCEFNFGANDGVVLHSFYTKQILQLVKEISVCYVHF